jgi:hypothetical protein
MLVVILAPLSHLSLLISGASLICLGVLGALAMAATAAVGKLFGTAIS